MVPEDALPLDIGPPDYPMLYRVADDRITSTGLFYGELEIRGMPPIYNVTIRPLGSKYTIGLGIIERYMVAFERGERVIVEL